MSLGKTAIVAALALFLFYAVLIFSLLTFFEGPRFLEVLLSPDTLFSIRLSLLAATAAMILAVAIAAYALYGKYIDQVPVQGWASLLVVVSFFSGSILAALGVIAEYLAVTMGIVMGKPLYVVSTKPTRPALRQ